ncbi:MAG TPA: ATP-binding protein [Blastocatellia bacterium]|nr:ATP-binding protein [Blastocatellia bacterium]
MMNDDKNWERLTDEIQLLNACLIREVRRRKRASEPSHLDHFQGLVLSEQEILEILTAPSHDLNMVDTDMESDQRLKRIEERISRQTGDEGLRAAPPLFQVTSLFQLERIEAQCLVLCLAPEIESKYSKVFAFLQDDVTKKLPTIDLALRLFCKGMQDRVAARAIFSPNAPLLRNRLLHPTDAPDGSGALSQRALKLDDRIASFLLETPHLDGYLSEWVEFIAPPDEPVRAVLPGEMRDRTIRMIEDCFSGGDAPVRPLIHLSGRKGSGRRSLAECASRMTGLPLLVADVRRMPSAGTERAEALWRLGREALLLPAAIFVENFDGLLQEGHRGELTALLDSVEQFSPLTFLSGSHAWKPWRPTQLFLSLECPVPDSTSRIGLWKEHLQGATHEIGDDILIELAGKFNFTDGQIRNAVEAARNRAFWESRPPGPLTAAMITQACRGVAVPNLGGLALKIEPCYSWSDIVLPESQLIQLREIAAHVKRAQTILETWGFAQKYPNGRGITAMFEGPSGTGKTMAAGIIGAELGLDLYKIDLSCVVSKYIGETEKNLNHIFEEAQDSNAILFFDEADALFGKRSEVKDAHDRYANIETAYLLQRMEDYSGIVILATNMKHNLDEAFVRRMRFIIHFPFPSDADRELIWERSFPKDAPLGRDIDFRWLARKLKITGGHIKNISLRAAFLAIERQGLIDMDCLVEAARREIEKTGKISSLTDFRPRENPKESFETAEVA